MKNMEMTVEEDILTIEVDLRKEFGPPSSGVSAHNPITVGGVSQTVFPKRDLRYR